MNEFSNNPKVFIWNGEGTLLSLSLRDFCSLINEGDYLFLLLCKLHRSKSSHGAFSLG